MRILLIRHGRTDGNIRRAYIGRTDELVLPEEIRKIRPVPWEKSMLLFVSPMRRCLMTAQALFPAWMENGSYETVEEFQEMDFGDFEGKSYEDLKENASYQAYIDSGGEAAFPRGESRAAFENRVKAAALPVFEKLLASASGEGETAAFVIHGGTIMALLDAFSSPHEDYFTWQTSCLCGFSADLAREEEKKQSFLIREVKAWTCPVS